MKKFQRTFKLISLENSLDTKPKQKISNVSIY